MSNHVKNTESSPAPQPDEQPTPGSLAVTRIANASVLLELNGYAILTDPWFTERWHLHRAEPLGMTVTDLPPLSAIVASHPVANHWDVRALGQYQHKSATPVYVSTTRMANQAKAIGYPLAENVDWGDTLHPAPDLSVEVVPAGQTLSMRNNAYVLSSGGLRVFFGGEISDVALLEQYRAGRPPVTAALLPVNGLHIPLGPRLVMGPKEAVDGATALDAQVLIPIHDAHANDPLFFMIRRRGSGAEAQNLARTSAARLDVVCLPPGQRWEYS